MVRIHLGAPCKHLVVSFRMQYTSGIMNALQIFLLALLQGITEFLPISSSGHLVILETLFNLEEIPFTYDLLLHLGTQVAVVIYFWPRIKEMFLWLTRREKTTIRLSSRKWWAVLFPLLVVTLPVAAVGLFASDIVKAAFSNVKYLVFTYILTALLLFSTKFIRFDKLKLDWRGLSFFKSLAIGVLQAVSTLPGVSRSGATIVGGLYVGLKSSAAFEFSFFAGLISITGASFVEILKTESFNKTNILQLLGALIAGIVGYCMLRFVGNIIKSGKFWAFSIYCLIMSLISLLVWLKF